MKVIRREFYEVSRSDEFYIVPIGDVHIGAAACDERKLRDAVARVMGDPNCFWIGMGDYGEWINRLDPRYRPDTLAPWITIADTMDLGRAQRDRFLEIVQPIAGKCLALVCGNHEESILKHSERDVYYEIVQGIKQFAGWPEDHPLAIGYNGWLHLHFYRSKKKERGTKLEISLHHGFGGGRLAGSKALNMQRWLWSHRCHLALFGHTHSIQVQVEAVERVVGSKVIHERRIGAICGSFLKSFNQDGSSTYSEVKGYLPQPVAGVEAILRPGANNPNDRIRMLI